MPDHITIEDRCILIEGPSVGDAGFYGRWLLFAAKVEELWEAIQDDNEFSALRIGYIPNFSIAAMDFVSRIKKNSVIIDLRPTEDMLELAVMTEFSMAEIGLFTPTGGRY